METHAAAQRAIEPTRTGAIGADHVHLSSVGLVQQQGGDRPFHVAVQHARLDVRAITC